MDTVLKEAKNEKHANKQKKDTFDRSFLLRKGTTRESRVEENYYVETPKLCKPLYQRPDSQSGTGCTVKHDMDDMDLVGFDCGRPHRFPARTVMIQRGICTP
jgi:hypothetical protein